MIKIYKYLIKSENEFESNDTLFIISDSKINSKKVILNFFKYTKMRRYRTKKFKTDLLKIEKRNRFDPRFDMTRDRDNNGFYFFDQEKKF